MPTGEPFWSKYIANAQLDLLVAAYTKVPLSWNEHDYVPDFNKMYYILEGEGFLKIEGQVFYPKPGELYLLPAGKLQSYGTLNERTFGKYWCHFTAKAGNLNLFDMVQVPSFVHIGEAEEMKQLFERLIRYSRGDDIASAFRVHSALLDILALYMDRCPEVRVQTKTTSAFGKMHKVMAYIEEHISEHLTVEELAQIAHFQPNYFIQRFKSLTGASPIQYINRLRLEKAAHQLLLSALSVSEIAQGVGMELSYFSRMFKEHTGYSPSAYREMVRAARSPQHRIDSRKKEDPL